MKKHRLSRIAVVLAALLIAVSLFLSPLTGSERSYAWVDTALDAAFLVVDASLCGAELIDGGTNLESCLSTGLDVVFLLIPYVPNLGSAAAKGLNLAGKTIDDADDVVEAYKQGKTVEGMMKLNLSVIDNSSDLYKSKSLFGRYGIMKRITSGLGDEINAHHLNPQALDQFFGMNVDDMMATIWSKRFHAQSKELDNITRKMNVLVDEVKTISGGNRYTTAGFTHYIGRVSGVYGDAGKLYQGVVMLDALATPAGHRWLTTLGVPANIIVHALNAASRNVMEHTAVSVEPADIIVATSVVDALRSSTSDAVRLHLFSALTGAPDGIPQTTDVTERYAGKDVEIVSVETGRFLCGENDSTVHAGGACEEANHGTYHTTRTSDGWVGFRLRNGKWLSVQDRDYLRTEGLALSSWECFRIYQYGEDLFLLSQKNYRFVQVTDESKARPLKACRDATLGLGSATWERFRIQEAREVPAAKPTERVELSKSTQVPVPTRSMMPPPTPFPTASPRPVGPASDRTIEQPAGEAISIFDLTCAQISLPFGSDTPGLRLFWNSNACRREGIRLIPYIEDLDAEGDALRSHLIRASLDSEGKETSAYLFNDGTYIGFQFNGLTVGHTYRVSVYAMPDGADFIWDALAVSETVTVTITTPVHEPMHAGKAPMPA